MDDALTQSVLAYQEGSIPLEAIRNQVLVEAFGHLYRYRRKGEDEISDFLLTFHGRIEGLLGRFQSRGLPFRHFLLRTLRWQWNTFRADQARQRRLDWLAVDHELEEETLVSEPVPTWETDKLPNLSPSSLRRLVLLALKAAGDLEEAHLEAVSRQTGVELSWLQACQYRLKVTTTERRTRLETLVQKRGEAFYRRLLAEDDARREADPERRSVHERRAGLYRSRLTSLSRQQAVLSTAPTHLELADLLGMPKGSVDSGLYHLKRELACVYHGTHDDDPGGDEQRPQKARA